jgi:nucleoside-diphosphate-sugar epimerase
VQAVSERREDTVMKILMIGGTRFIGAHVVRRLHDAGAEIVVFHRGASTNPILPEVEHVLDPGAQYPVTDFPIDCIAIGTLSSTWSRWAK